MTSGPKDLVPAASELLLYAAPDGAVKVRVLFKDETARLTQKAVAKLFGVKVPTVAQHLKNIFDSVELSRSTTVSNAADGKTNQVECFNVSPLGPRRMVT